MRINYNVSAMLSNNALANNDSLLAQSLERLSSGLKINHGKDNPAGLAMAKRMNAQIEGLSQANDNANDGISVIEIADGAMSEISDILQRMNELAIKAANGTMSDSDKATVQDEVSQLKEEITRISETTEFNGQKILNGEFELKGYVYGDVNVKVASYSKDVPTKEYFIDSIKIQKEMVKTPVKDENGLVMKDEDGNDVEEDTWTGAYLAEVTGPAGQDGFPNGDGYTSKMNKDNLLTITGTNGFEMVLDLSGINRSAEEWTKATTDQQNSVSVNKKFEELEYGEELTYKPQNDDEQLKIDATGIGAMRLQIGANEGQVLPVEIPKISLRNMGIENLDVSALIGAIENPDGDLRGVNGALKGIEEIDGAIRFVSKIRGMLGAYQNRLESTVDSLDVMSENMTAAYSRIMDVDMAEEMTNYTTYQILTQAGTSMLAQANERPSQVLQLLQ